MPNRSIILIVALAALVIVRFSIDIVGLHARTNTQANLLINFCQQSQLANDNAADELPKFVQHSSQSPTYYHKKTQPVLYTFQTDYFLLIDTYQYIIQGYTAFYQHILRSILYPKHWFG